MTEEQNKLAEEIAEFQQRVYSLCEKFYPDVDGGGTDSGDWRDFTLAEIEQTFNHLAEREPATEAVRDEECWEIIKALDAEGKASSLIGYPLTDTNRPTIRAWLQKRIEERALKGKGASQGAAQEQEPCAWRYRYGKNGMWKYADSPEEMNPSPEYEREPLYPLPWKSPDEQKG